jgi:hypothetical protein
LFIEQAQYIEQLETEAPNVEVAIPAVSRRG